MSKIQKELDVPLNGPIPDGILLRARRNFLGLKSEDIASAARRSQSLISQIETGAKNPGNILLRLSPILGISPDELRAVPREEVVNWLHTGVPKRPLTDKLKAISIENPFTIKVRTKFGSAVLRVNSAEIIEGDAIFSKWLDRQSPLR